jgi:hypothetical protein
MTVLFVLGAILVISALSPILGTDTRTPELLTHR